MMLSDLVIRLTDITNNTCSYSRVPVILRTLDDDFGVSCIEFENGKLVLHTDQQVDIEI